MASHPIYQFRAELKDYRPKMWRRFQVMNNMTMARLGYAIMAMYGMDGAHLFCFDMERTGSQPEGRLPDGLVVSSKIMTSGPQNWRFEIISNELDMPFVGKNERIFDVMESKVRDVISVPKEKMVFTYDLGDEWMIDITLEEIIEDKELPGTKLPRVLDGEGSGIIEDCGGVHGLANIARAFKEKSGKNYEMYRNWLGKEELDLETLDVNILNFGMKSMTQSLAFFYNEAFR